MSQQLTKQLRLRHLVVFGLAYMTPIIVLGTYGVLSQITDNGVPLAYACALAVMMLTAFSYSRMAKICTESGSAYSYVKFVFGSKVGFFAGWTILLDYLFLPMVITLIGAVYLASLIPEIPKGVWIFIILGTTTTVNWIGLKVAEKANILLLITQLLILTAFTVLCIHYSIDSSKPFWNLSAFFAKDNALLLIAAGAAIACYSFLGFDAITTLAEETVETEKNMPRAILLTTLIGGIIFIVTSTAVQFSHPDAHFSDPDSAASVIARNIGGDIFVTIFVIGLVIGQLASCISAQASGSRLIYTMAKRQALPPILAKLNRHNVPGVAVLIMAVVGLAALFLDLTTSTSFINFGAFIGFCLVNIAVIKHFWGQGQMITTVIIPLCGAIATVILFSQLDTLAFVLGFSWLGIGIIRYFIVGEELGALDHSD